MYYCDICKKIFKQKNDIRRHLNRKNICGIESQKINRDYVAEKYDIILEKKNKYKNCYKYLVKNYEDNYKLLDENKIKNDSEILKIKDSEILNQNNDKICKYCNKYFSRQDSKIRHIKYFCKVKKENDNNIINNNNITHTTINNITNNIQNIQNIQNNIINKTEIKINSFGSENISYITDDIIKMVKENPENGIPKLVELIHFNPKYPENHNIKIENKKDKFVDLYLKDKWTYVDIKEALQNIIVTKKKITDSHKEEECNEKINNEYKRFASAIDFYMNNLLFKDQIPPSMKGNKKLYSKLEKQILLLILDQRRQIEEEYKNDLQYIL